MQSVADSRTSQHLAEIIEVFEETLEADGEVDAHSDFFELGGNSLLAARTVAALRRRFATKVTVREFFDARTPTGILDVVIRRIAADAQ
ncbi:acyl carrier protein [Streptomyces sp. NPDC051001]|uniref:acyl carrier protein n=1 Tax=Streptomyces sp. NPDC051001 TaxID=3155795 RepID=UPI00342ED91F